MGLRVTKPGMLSTFQDMGRHGFQHLGVPTAGAMDRRAHQLANILVGNTTSLATLEITLTGPSLVFSRACCIALTGANLTPQINRQNMVMNRPIIVRAGDELSFGARLQGARSYLAVHGGYHLDTVLASDSTYLRSNMGGLQGRALRRDDFIELNYPLKDTELDRLAHKLWDIEIYLPAILAPTPRQRIRIIKSNQWKDFTPESCAAMLTETFKISPDSERMGYRLSGPSLSLIEARQMISEATTFGTIQVPAGGQAIVLMADTQTTGGYPKIAYVASIDLPQLAQRLPGDTIQFETISLKQAQALDRARHLAFEGLTKTLVPIKTLLTQYRMNQS
jgi:antagonist of KipI